MGVNLLHYLEINVEEKGALTAVQCIPANAKVFFKGTTDMITTLKDYDYEGYCYGVYDDTGLVEEVKFCEEKKKKKNITKNKNISVKKLLKLLEEGADVNETNKDKMTLLHLTNNPEVVKLLLEYGADVAMPCNLKKKSVVHNMIDHYDIIKTLMYMGADICHKDENNEQPVVHAKGDVLQLLLNHGANPTARDSLCNTLLHLNVNYPEDISILLNVFNLNPNSTNSRGQTALHEAVISNDEPTVTDTIKALLEHGVNINHRDEENRSALHFANSIEVAEFLIDHGANILHDDVKPSTLENKHVAKFINDTRSKFKKEHPGLDKNLRNALHLAKTAKDVTNALETNHINHVDENGYTPLHLADNEEVVHELVKHGADVNAHAIHGETPLHLASNLDVVKALVCYGADINALDCRGNPPLFFKDVDIADYLIRHGANVNAQNTNGKTALWHVNDDKELAELLLMYGIDPNHRDCKGKTALFNAECAGIEKMVKYGADVHTVDKEGKNPLHYAFDKEQITDLIKYGVDAYKSDRFGNIPTMFNDLVSKVKSFSAPI